jgi:hypothetical protein
MSQVSIEVPEDISEELGDKINKLSLLMGK